MLDHQTTTHHDMDAEETCAPSDEHTASASRVTTEPVSTAEAVETAAVTITPSINQPEKAPCSSLKGTSDLVSQALISGLDSTESLDLPSSQTTEKTGSQGIAGDSGYYPINWTFSKPKLYGTIADEFDSNYHKVPLYNNYLRGCMWSPDGLCLLTHSFDNTFRIFDFPPAMSDSNEVLSYDSAPMTTELPVILRTLEHELVYDYCWYPYMQSDDPFTCCFVSTSRRMPVRLWDAYNGSQRAIYQPINHLGELVAARSVAFSADGQLLYCGLSRYIQVFRVDRPSVILDRRPPLGCRSIQGGIFSAIGVPKPNINCGSNVPNVYAVGTFSGTIVVYSEQQHGMPFSPLLQGPKLGVSQLLFVIPASGVTPWYLVAGGRADGTMYVWDPRMLKSQVPLAIFRRRVENYQRFQIDADPTGQYLFSGNQTGAVSCYDINALKLVSTWRGHEDSCHGVSVHPYLPVLATASGQKRPLLTPHLGVKRSHRSVLDKTVTKASKSGCTSSSSSDSEDELPRALTDAEATAVGTNDTTTKPPMSNRLDLLPIRKEVKMWTFPLSK